MRVDIILGNLDVFTESVAKLIFAQDCSWGRTGPRASVASLELRLPPWLRGSGPHARALLLGLQGFQEAVPAAPPPGLPVCPALLLRHPTGRPPSLLLVSAPGAHEHSAAGTQSTSPRGPSLALLALLHSQVACLEEILVPLHRIWEQTLHSG